MRRKLIAGNWKMNGSYISNAILLNGIKVEVKQLMCEIAVCAPAPYLAQCQAELSGTSIAWGGQDISVHESGAYTGEISGAMLADFGCKYVIVGHSERRAYHGESNELVAQKTIGALKRGLIPIVCVGESLSEREAGRAEVVVGRQIDVVLALIGPSELASIVIAYEPIWAVGTGKTATPQTAQDIHAMLRAKLRGRDLAAAAEIRILYGGSMRPDNAEELLMMPDIDGGLIGGASLKAADFLAIARAA